MQGSRILSIALVAPALLLVAALFLVPLGYSLASAFVTAEGALSLANFTKAFEFYAVDIAYTVIIIGLATAVIAVIAIAIGGYLVLGRNPTAVAVLLFLMVFFGTAATLRLLRREQVEF